MPWPVHPNGLLGAQGDNDTYRIERSLRFNSADSAYLNRTFSGTPTTYTLSWWLKRGTLSTTQDIFASRQGASNPSYIEFTTSNTLVLGFAASVALTTTSVFRDTSSWYHFVVAVTPSATSYLYVNGSQIGTWTASSNPYLFNSAYTNAIGRYGDAAQNYFDGYLAEINFIDGQALTPSSFGETDAITGRWKAKAYSGTYGTNGFYLKFADNSGTTSTTLGKDSSGNGNNWTPNNFSVTAGAENDSLVDSPTNYGADTGVGGEVRGNYATLNPISTIRGTIIDGNLRTNGGDRGSISTIGMSFGKWFCEMTVTTVGFESSIGVSQGLNIMNTYVGASSDSWGYRSNGPKYNNATSVSYGASYTSGDIIGCSFDADNGTLVFYKNGVSQGTAYTGLTSGPYYFAVSGRSATANDVSVNFGQRPFAYTAPSGFKALCTTNLPQPTIQKPSKYMDAVAYTGTGASNSITSLGFSPDLVWIKNRGAATSHAIYDTTRGTGSQLSSDTTGDAVTSSSGLTAFGASGFTIGTGSLVNTSGTQYVGWAWDEARISGMDIVSYTGNGANRTISHNLGIAPNMIIVKAVTTAGADQGWPVWHSSISNTTYLTLNTTSATTTGADYWNSTTPTSSVFSLGTNVAVNANNDTYIAYLFDEVEGFSKFGSYTGNGGTDGPFVWCGFRPKYVLFKNASAAYHWFIYDTARNTVNAVTSNLYASSSAAEQADASLDILSNGFKLRSATYINDSTNTIIFAAFAESPFKYARAR